MISDRVHPCGAPSDTRHGTASLAVTGLPDRPVKKMTTPPFIMLKNTRGYSSGAEPPAQPDTVLTAECVRLT